MYDVSSATELFPDDDRERERCAAIVELYRTGVLKPPLPTTPLPPPAILPDSTVAEPEIFRIIREKLCIVVDTKNNIANGNSNNAVYRGLHVCKVDICGGDEEKKCCYHGQKTLAVKLIKHADFAIKNAMKLQHKLKHRGILNVYFTGECCGYLIVITDYIEKPQHLITADLYSYIDYLDKNNIALKPDEIYDIMHQLVDILHYLHMPSDDKGIIVHGDIKLENIVIQQDAEGKYHVYLIDFDSAVEFESNNDIRKYGSPHIGTISYMCPDCFEEYQFKHSRKSRQTVACDIWALGCVMFSLWFPYCPFTYLVFAQKSWRQFIYNYGQYYTKHNKIPEAFFAIVIQDDVKARWYEMGLAAMHLMCRMLDTNAVTRINIDSIMAHPFVTKRALTESEAVIFRDDVEIRCKST